MKETRLMTDKMIIGLSGVLETKSGERVGTMGVGKDTLADYLSEKYCGVKVALADPIKRICQAVYDFSDEQLWGKSKYRNALDRRYLRRHSYVLTNYEGNQVEICECCQYAPGISPKPDDPDLCYLTPRYAIQKLGTEWGRGCYLNTWVDYALRVATLLLKEPYEYSYKKGLLLRSQAKPTKLVVVPDIRYKNELQAIKNAENGRCVRIVRVIADNYPPRSPHGSEQDLLEVPDSVFDQVIYNDADLALLSLRADQAMARLHGKIIEYDEAQ